MSKGIAKKAIEVHGGMGFTDLLGLHYWFKRIGLNRQILGSLELIREEALKFQLQHNLSIHSYASFQFSHIME
jgi:alkylation response protein AidB-like acyl-CoA dehydrogenase